MILNSKIMAFFTKILQSHFIFYSIYDFLLFFLTSRCIFALVGLKPSKGHIVVSKVDYDSCVFHPAGFHRSTLNKFYSIFF